MLLNFCYTGRIVLTAHNALPIIRAAAVLKMPDAMSICFEYITTQLNASNCVHYLDCSRNQKSFESFHKFVQKYAVEHFDEILEHESFNLLSAHDLSEFLRNDNLSIHSEENLFRALTKWHKKDPKNRQSAMKDMLPLIRYGDLSKKVCMQSTTIDLSISVFKSTEKSYIKYSFSFLSSSAKQSNRRLRNLVAEIYCSMCYIGV